MRQLPTYDGPPAARADGPDTSWAGWNHVRKNLRSRQAQVVAVLACVPGGLTGGEVAARMGVAHNWISGRIRELVRLGVVEDSGSRRIAPTGQSQIVWRAKQ